MRRFCVICQKEFDCGCNRERGASSITCSSQCEKVKKFNYNKNWNRNHPEKTTVYKSNYRINLRMEIIKILGERCSNPNCEVPGGMRDSRTLQIDHVNGNGNLEISKFNNLSSYYFFILNKIREGSKDYQLLCANCNWIKRVERKEQSQLKYGGRVY